MPRGPDFFRQLTEQTLEALEEYARQPGRTGDEAHDWLAERAVKTSRSAVYRWFQDFRLEDKTRRAAEVAKGYLAAAREADPASVTEASLRKFEELVFDWTVQAEDPNAQELLFIANAMKSGLGSRRELVDLRRKQADALKAADEQARTGASAGDVVATIKTALGIAA